MELPTKVPPPWFRLLVITPVVFLGCLVVTVLSPLLHLVLALIDLVDRKQWRFTRLGGLGIALCVCELVGLLMAFGLWVGSGFGWAIRRPAFQRAHNAIFGWYLEMLTRALRRYLGFEFVIPTTERVTGPVLTFARHAGPGDAFLLARTVIRDYHRQLRMLGTTKLLWDPFIDHVLRRMPYHFCDQDPTDATASLAAISEMCRTMDDRSVLIVFPEGGNWTPRRWTAAIERLQARGLHERAARASATMTNVLPPRTAGAIAALGARDDVTVVFVAHVGLEDLYSLREIWRKIPLRRRVAGAYWSVPATAIPTDRDALSGWLYGEWERVDRWIVDHQLEAYGT
jgi:1-acyl-sn-glycerol-3-phosphate acyltransferase